MAVRHEDAPAGDPQEALEREQCTEVAVAAYGVEAYGRIRCAEVSNVGFAIPAVEHAGDFGVPKHRLLQVGRVTVRIGDDQDVHASTPGDNERSMSTSIPDIAGIATMARHILSSNIGLHLPFIRYSVYNSNASVYSLP